MTVHGKRAIETKPGRIAKGSRPPKTLSIHHLTGRAAMRRESRPRTGQSRQQASAANERLLEPPLPKEPRRQKSQHALDERPVALPPLSLDTAGGEEAPREPTQGVSRSPPLSSRPSEGMEEEEGRASGCMTSKEVPARGEEFDTEGRQKPEGQNDLYVQHKSNRSKHFPLCQRPNHTDEKG